jgi:RNA polymerase sigma factor (sigma-70 family)
MKPASATTAEDCAMEGPPESAADRSTDGLSASVLRILVENHGRFLDFLERRVQRRDVAEEILQEAFVRGIARSASVRNDESAVAWFYRVLRNGLADHYRRVAVEQRALSALAVEPGGAAETTDPPSLEDDPDLRDAICNCLTSLLPTLKPSYADALQRVDLAGGTLSSLAESAGITPGNAAVRLFRARQALRRRVEQSCGTCAGHGCYQCQCQSQHAAPAARA